MEAPKSNHQTGYFAHPRLPRSMPTPMFMSWSWSSYCVSLSRSPACCCLRSARRVHDLCRQKAACSSHVLHRRRSGSSSISNWTLPTLQPPSLEPEDRIRRPNNLHHTVTLACNTATVREAAVWDSPKPQAPSGAPTNSTQHALWRTALRTWPCTGHAELQAELQAELHAHHAQPTGVARTSAGVQRLCTVHLSRAPYSVLGRPHRNQSHGRRSWRRPCTETLSVDVVAHVCFCAWRPQLGWQRSTPLPPPTPHPLVTEG